MAISIFLAKFFCIYFIIIGSVFIFRKEFFKQVTENMYENPAIVAVTALLQIIIGLLIVLNHNIWVLDWFLFFTLLGYFLVFFGTFRLYRPYTGKENFRKMLSTNIHTYVGLGLILLGIWLGYLGFIVNFNV